MTLKLIKSTISENYFELLMIESNFFTFTYDESGNKFYEINIIFKIILDDIRPSTAIGANDMEEKLSLATLQKYENNIQTFTKKDQKDLKGNQATKPCILHQKILLLDLYF